MKLHDLLAYDNIVVQCHDNPDADALASGFAVYLYLKENGKNVSLIYGGRTVIRKSNLVFMVKELQIPISYVETLEPPELLVTVDCQYGGGNVTRFEAEHVAVLDHHRVSGKLPELSEVRSSLGACSTLIWELLKEEQYDTNTNEALATALYYGLYTDTGGFAEISHPLDRDLRDQAKFNTQLMTRFRNANLSIEDLEIAGTALLRSDYIEDYRCAIVKAGECDSNILGIISDFVLEVDAVDICLVFNVTQAGAKISVRSCVKEVQANELAEEICKGIGSGGGHFVKAGGFIPMDYLILEYENYCESHNVTPRMVLSPDGKTGYPTVSGVKAVLESRMVNYFENSQIIYAKTYQADTSGMKEYYRKPIPMGYVKATNLFEAGTEITVRTLEGDIDTRIEEDTIFMVGAKGEVYLNKEDKFLMGYRTYDWQYSLKHAEYRPTIKDNAKGNVISLLKHAKVCVPNGKVTIKARHLDHNVKIFSEWDETKYMKGSSGDYLLIRGEDLHDIYTVNQEIFESGYERVNAPTDNNTQAVIFDLDGTLLDTLQDLADAVNAALRGAGMPERTIEEVRQFVGNGIEKLMIRAVPDGNKNPRFEEVFAAFKEYYGAHCKDHTGPYPNIQMMMEELKQRGIKMAIVSNKLDSAVKELDKEYFSGLTMAAIGEMEGVARKPAPDMAEKAIAELGVDKEHTVYVGDSDVDIETAKNAGLTCISVAWGFRSRKFLKEHGAVEIIDKPLELLSLV